MLVAEVAGRGIFGVQTPVAICPFPPAQVFILKIREGEKLDVITHQTAFDETSIIFDADGIENSLRPCIEIFSKKESASGQERYPVGIRTALPHRSRHEGVGVPCIPSDEGLVVFAHGRTQGSLRANSPARRSRRSISTTGCQHQHSYESEQFPPHAVYLLVDDPTTHKKGEG